MAELDAGALAGRTLLVVEDEYFLAQDIVRVFERAGATLVGPVASVDDALELIEAAAALDGAVLDVNLMGETVFPVADALLARTVPFVFATGYDALHLPIGYRHVPCLHKPVDAEIVARTLFASRSGGGATC